MPVNPKVAWTAGLAGVGGIVLVMTQMGMHSQNRQYDKTLKIYKDGKAKAQGYYLQAEDKVKDTVGKK